MAGGSGPACPGSELRDDLAGGGTGSGAGVRERDRRRHLRGSIRVAAGRRDRHGCLQRDVGVLAAHRTAIDQPAAIWLELGYGYARPAGLKVRRESTAIARWPDHDASVALPPAKGAATRGVLITTRPGRPRRLADGAVALCDEPSVSGRTPSRRYAFCGPRLGVEAWAFRWNIRGGDEGCDARSGT